jgi:L-ascorbate metabolism protein UlaG (beta-lactamase superfamily)
MVITYFGGGCFRLQSGDRSCLIDPVSARLKADVVLRTALPTAEIASGERNGFGAPLPGGHISFSGEYEIHGWAVEGFPLRAESGEGAIRTAYLVRQEELSCAVPGTLRKPLEVELTEKIGEPDILIVPGDGKEFFSPEAIAKLAKQLSPRLLVVGAREEAKKITKALGENGEAQEKVVVKKRDVSSGKTKTVVLTVSY